MKLMRKRPVKIIFFIIWIVVHSILLSAVAIFFKPWVILVPCGTLAFVILLMVIYSRFVPCQIGHKIPLAYLFAAGVLIIIHGILLVCLLRYWLHIIANFLLVMVLIMVVLFDLELIVHDKTRHKFGKHEYIVATMILYRDVVWIIIILLIILLVTRNCGRGEDESGSDGDSGDSAESGDSASSSGGGSS
nr:uncharacterized protein LOC108065965 [Drosophila takahashii]